MINEKQEILATVNTLPDNTTWDDAVYTLYLHSKLQKSKDDIKNGRVMSIEESKEKMGAQHPLGRLGHPKDIASMVAFLLSEEADWISGQIIGVDGGRSKL